MVIILIVTILVVIILWALHSLTYRVCACSLPGLVTQVTVLRTASCCDLCLGPTHQVKSRHTHVRPCLLTLHQQAGSHLAQQLTVNVGSDCPAGTLNVRVT
jgi:hypothetical protein